MIEFLTEHMEYLITFVVGLVLGITSEYMHIFHKMDMYDPENYEWVYDEYRGKGREK